MVPKSENAEEEMTRKRKALDLEDLPATESVGCQTGYIWDRDFAEWNAENLHTHGVLDVSDLPFKFVIDSHPIIALLRANEHLIGRGINDVPKVDKYYKVSNQVINHCCQTLQEKVLGVDGSNSGQINSFELTRE